MKHLASVISAIGIALASGLGGGAQAQAPFPFDVDLVAYWPFDDDLDPTPDDLAPAEVVSDDGHFVAGAGYQGGTDLPPISGNVDALELSGTSGYLNVPDSIDLDLTGGYTLALWVKPDSMQGSFADILRKEDSFQTTGYGIEAQRDGGNVYFSGWKNGTILSTSFRCWGEFPPNPAESFPLTADTWQHLAVAKTGGTRLIYVDAVLVNSCTHPDPVVGTNNAPLQMGAWTVFGRPWDGKLDDVRIYDRGLTAEEIEVIFKGSITVTIDIKPGSDPNSMNLGAAGVVPVAIFSTEDFDATMEIDPDTVSLAGARVKMVGKSNRLLCHAELVDEDDLLDLVCQVETAQFMIEEGDSTAVLEAETFDGVPVHGEDQIRIVPD